MGKSIFAFIWRYSKREQIIVLLMTLASFPFLYLSLEVPKTIINEALGGGSFPKPLFGFELGQITYLLTLCTVFLGALRVCPRILAPAPDAAVTIAGLWRSLPVAYLKAGERRGENRGSESVGLLWAEGDG